MKEVSLLCSGLMENMFQFAFIFIPPSPGKVILRPSALELHVLKEMHCSKYFVASKKSSLLKEKQFIKLLLLIVCHII